MKDNYQEFLDTLLFNVKQRSRTASGKSTTNVSTVKLPLLLNGELLEAKVQENLRTVAPIVWETDGFKVSSKELRRLFDDWFDVIQDGLIDYGGYAPKREELQKKWAEELDRPIKLNPRYRIWEVHYDLVRVKPYFIDVHLNEFIDYIGAAWGTPICNDHEVYVRHLAFLDRELDRIIHPWLDGCGRFATILIMWVAKHTDLPYPRLKGHSEHYANMTFLDTHKHYFEEITRLP